MQSRKPGCITSAVMRFWQILFVIFLFAFVGFFIYDFAVKRPQAVRMQPTLEAAFRQIPPPSDSRRVDYQVTVKSDSVLVTAAYTVSGTYGEILAYYNAKLIATGWHFMKETPLTVGSQNLNGTIATYCENDLQADIQYVGEPANYGWTYAFSIEWGNMGHDCQA